MTNRTPTVGDRVRCKVSGFEGIVSAHAKHLAGCDRLYVTPKVDRAVPITLGPGRGSKRQN